MNIDTIIKKEFIFLLTSPEARYLVVPIITLLLANLAKFFCQKDSVISRESFYWGPNIVMSAILILFVDFSNRILYETNKIAFSIHVMTALGICILILLGMIAFIKVWGWEIDRYDKTKYRIGKYCGVIIPDLIGFATLYIILNFM